MNKECLLKILAVMVAMGILFSLWTMHKDICFHSGVNYSQYPLAGPIELFDKVFIAPEHTFGVVEGITNNVYTVMYHDSFNNVIHATFKKNQLQKVFVLEGFHRH